jgi:exopolysaccharide production protein ExoY
MSLVSPRDFSAALPVSADLSGQNAHQAADATLARAWRPVLQSVRPQRGLGDDRPIGGHAKRAFDIVVAALALLLLSPLLLTLAAAIKLLSGGDALYRHRRVGFGGRSFYCLKFRTMVTNGEEVLQRHFKNNPAAAEEWRRTRKLADDPRVTHLGYFLRKTSLDELPQLFNILRGDMSCVGPRPIVVDELQYYGDHARDYFKARPGLTGLWQVSGRSLTSYQSRVNYDVQYLQKWSLSKDLLIIARTIPAMLNTEQAA